MRTRIGQALAKLRGADLPQPVELQEAGDAAGFACTVCRETRALAPFEQRSDPHGNIYDLWICLNCLAVLNATHLRMIHNGVDFLSWQSDSSDEFYAVDDAYLASVPQAIDECGFIDFLFSVYPQNPKGVLVDFGAGRGIVAGAAAKHFNKVYAVELSLNVLQKVHASMPLKEKVITTDDFASIPDKFDCITSMHVLEHLPEMRDILDALVSRLNRGGSLFFQVPMLRKEYLVNVHYTFFNEASARSLCNSLGLETVGIWFDHNLDFLTCVAKKP